MRAVLFSIQNNLNAMGLQYIHNILHANGHDSYLVYLNRFDPADREAFRNLSTFIKERSPDLFGISLTAIDFHPARALTQLLKEAFPSVPMLWGGIHCTTTPEECVKHADYICRGEGDGVILDVAEALDAGKDLKGIANLAYQENGQTMLNPVRPLIQDLDSQPISRQIPVNSFIQIRRVMKPLDAKHLARFKVFYGRFYRIIISRGCPYNCSYCCEPYVHELYGQSKMRRRSVEHVMRELELAMKEGPRIDYVIINDECFLANDMEYFREFSEQYKKRIKKPFLAKSTAALVNDECLDILVDAGLAWVNIGLQSGSEHVCRELYNRRISPNTFLRAAETIHKHGLACHYDVIMDNPWETDEDLIETTNFLASIPQPYAMQTFSLVFYHGSPLRERAMKEFPERVTDPTLKDQYTRTSRSLLVDICLSASTLPPWIVHALVRRYKKSPKSFGTWLAVFCCKWIHLLVLSPITLLWLIWLSQRKCVARTLKAIPAFIDLRLVSVFNFLQVTKDSTYE